MRRFLWDEQIASQPEAVRDGPDAALASPEVPYLVRPLVAIVPPQRLVAELARRRGTNPDTIRSDEEPWAAAMR